MDEEVGQRADEEAGRREPDVEPDRLVPPDRRLQDAGLMLARDQPGGALTRNAS